MSSRRQNDPRVCRNYYGSLWQRVQCTLIITEAQRVKVPRRPLAAIFAYLYEFLY